MQTGWEGDDLEGWQPSVVTDLDVGFRLLELDADRRHSSVRHFTTPVPVPGAMSLTELYELLVSALALPSAAAAAAQKLLQPADQVTGLLAC